MIKYLMGAVIAVLLFAAVPAFALGGTYAFDPVLSLTGGCTTSSVDTVPDPGCPNPPHPPSGSFSSPRSVATDSYGNIYVVSYGSESDVVNGAEGRIDIFDSSGLFITEVADPSGPKSVAVDSAGNMYVYNFRPPVGAMSEIAEVVRYAPTLYHPEGGEISYGGASNVVQSVGNSVTALAIDWANDHLFVHNAGYIAEYGSAAEDNKLIDESIGLGTFKNFMGSGLAIDATRGRLYANDGSANGEVAIDIFDLGSHALIGKIERSDTPTGGKFAAEVSVAVSEQTGDVFVYDGGGSEVVYQFDASGEYTATIQHSFQHVIGSQISVDNGPDSPNKGYLFVPSHPSGPGHAFAFTPGAATGPPTIDALLSPEVTETEATMKGTVNPHNSATTYTFQYTTEASFEERGFEGALTAGQGQIPSGAAGVEVSATAFGLTSGTSYIFRLLASNQQGTVEEQGRFQTYPSALVDGSSCGNALFRTGPSAVLPDCRAYELVTPPDTNAREPIGVGWLGSAYFPTLQASPAGDALNFEIEGGGIPGTEGTGSFAGDPYLATRGAGGWTTAYTGPTGEEAPDPQPGSNSSDQRYSFWGTASRRGTAAIGDYQETKYVRYPDGHSELVGRGSLGTDSRADGKLIAPNGSHILFVSSDSPPHVPVQLEPNAPPSGTQAIYDRTPDEVTHVVSLLPGDATPAAGEDALYRGASLDGEGVAFSIGSKLYLRFDNEETYGVGEHVTFAGVAEGGDRVFYLEGGNLKAFDVQSRVISFSTGGSVTPVNISADGTTAYFVSPNVLTKELNPSGTKAKAGQENLYRSREGALSFVGIVTVRDVEGENPGNSQVEGLGLWVGAVETGRLAADPSRTTPDGSVLLFESRANLTSYASAGHAEVYRYDFSASSLACLSCNPTGAAPVGRASLESLSQEQGDSEPFSSYALVTNLRDDGRRAFFQSDDALVAGDVDGLQDVYEWEDQGVGSCIRPGGCVYLISSGHSQRVDYLFAVSATGDDVFFRTGDLLLPADADETPSIYDARVGGGFAEDHAGTCEGEGCRNELEAPPAFAPPATHPVGPASKRIKHCLKGKRKVKRHGKVRCVRKHGKHHHRRAASGKKGGRK